MFVSSAATAATSVAIANTDVKIPDSLRANLSLIMRPKLRDLHGHKDQLGQHGLGVIEGSANSEFDEVEDQSDLSQSVSPGPNHT
jgi:hypothetical protein